MALSVSPDDVAARWRPLSVDEQAVAEVLIADAIGILTARRPSLDADVTAELVVADLVTAVVAQMVLRVLRNPDGLRQESVGDYSYIRDNAVSAGLLYVAEEELALLSPSNTAATSASFSITPNYEQPWTRLGWPCTWPGGETP